MTDFLEDYSRRRRDEAAELSRQLWDAPPAGQAKVTLTESQVRALAQVFVAVEIHTTGMRMGEPLRKLLDDITTSLFTQMGAAQARRQIAADRKRERRQGRDQSADPLR